jgi:hypothetical protein
MVHANLRGARLGPALGVLLLGGLFTAASPSEGAQLKPRPGTTAPGKGKGLALPPRPLKLTIVSKDPDVAEMAKVINTRLEAGWKANKVTPAPYVDDYEFIRRASLDIIGRIARPEEIVRYMKDPADRRRSLLIERLLKDEDYARHWANLWSNWLLTRSGPFGRGTYKEQMTRWLEDQLAQNKPYHEMVTKLLTAKGKNTENGAVNFILAHVGEPVPRARQKEEGHFEMVPLTSRVTRLFLGVQVQCAQCHPHPFHSALKQEHFWQVNAFLRQVNREGAVPVAMPRMAPRGPLTLLDDEEVNAEGNVFYEQRNGKVVMKKGEFLPPGGKGRGPKMTKQGLARREELAKDVVGHENFPRAIVNRMWGVFFGRGFVNPVDDFNDNNQPSNPDLLDELAERFKHYDYDLKKLIRWMTHSNAYHLSYVANKTNDKAEQETLFSRMVMKSMSPEQLFESLMVATRAEVGENQAAKKALRDQWLRELIANFGDDEGNEVNFNGTVVQALMMMNGKAINDAIGRKDKGTVALAIVRHRGRPEGVIADLYLASLNRRPRPQEVRSILTKMRLRDRAALRDTLVARYEDLFWALLNSNEFLLNH